jgi:hypothetical protein
LSEWSSPWHSGFFCRASRGRENRVESNKTFQWTLPAARPTPLNSTFYRKRGHEHETDIHALQCCFYGYGFEAKAKKTAKIKGVCKPERRWGRPTRATNRRFDAAVDFTAAGNASCQEPAEGVTGAHQGSHQIRVRIGSTEGNSAPESVSSAADSMS